MPTWIWWVIGGLATFYVNRYQERQTALQTIDIGLLMIRSSSTLGAQQATNRAKLLSKAGVLDAESTVPANLQTIAQNLSTSTLAADWLAIAAEVESAGFPLLAYSISNLAMNLLETGQLNLT